MPGVLSAHRVLLLTATITPLPGLPAIARTDPALRLQDYHDALGLYLGLLERGVFRNLVFAENSAADLTALKRLVAERGLSERVEFVSFNGLDYAPSKGRGYGEFRMVDHAMAHATALRDNEHAVVWKCTGRYAVRNLEAIVRASGSFDIHCHCRNHPLPWCELYLLAWNRRGYNGLIRNLYPQLANDLEPPAHTTEEILFRRLVDASTAQLRVVPRFKRHPVVEGVRAWNNQRFASRWASPKTWLRSVCTRWVPSLWI